MNVYLRASKMIAWKLAQSNLFVPKRPSSNMMSEVPNRAFVVVAFFSRVFVPYAGYLAFVPCGVKGVFFPSCETQQRAEEAGERVQTERLLAPLSALDGPELTISNWPPVGSSEHRVGARCSNGFHSLDKQGVGGGGRGEGSGGSGGGGGDAWPSPRQPETPPVFSNGVLVPRPFLWAGRRGRSPGQGEGGRGTGGVGGGGGGGGGARDSAGFGVVTKEYGRGKRSSTLSSASRQAADSAAAAGGGRNRTAGDGAGRLAWSGDRGVLPRPSATLQLRRHDGSAARGSASGNSNVAAAYMGRLDLTADHSRSRARTCSRDQAIIGNSSWGGGSVQGVWRGSDVGHGRDGGAGGTGAADRLGYVRAVITGSRGGGGDGVNYGGGGGGGGGRILGVGGGGGGSGNGGGVAAAAVVAAARGLRDAGDDALTLSSSGLSVTSGEDFDAEEACDIDDECEDGMYGNFDEHYHDDDQVETSSDGARVKRAAGVAAARSERPVPSAASAVATVGTVVSTLTSDERSNGTAQGPPDGQTRTPHGASAGGTDPTRLGTRAGTAAAAGVAAVSALVWPATTAG